MHFNLWWLLVFYSMLGLGFLFCEDCKKRNIINCLFLGVVLHVVVVQLHLLGNYPNLDFGFWLFGLKSKNGSCIHNIFHSIFDKQFLVEKIGRNQVPYMTFWVVVAIFTKVPSWQIKKSLIMYTKFFFYITFRFWRYAECLFFY